MSSPESRNPASIINFATRLGRGTDSKVRLGLSRRDPAFVRFQDGRIRALRVIETGQRPFVAQSVGNQPLVERTLTEIATFAEGGPEFVLSGIPTVLDETGEISVIIQEEGDRIYAVFSNERVPETTDDDPIVSQGGIAHEIEEIHGSSQLRVMSLELDRHGFDNHWGLGWVESNQGGSVTVSTELLDGKSHLLAAVQQNCANDDPVFNALVIKNPNIDDPFLIRVKLDEPRTVGSDGVQSPDRFFGASRDFVNPEHFKVAAQRIEEGARTRIYIAFQDLGGKFGTHISIADPK